jgi:hypothetical protein
MVRFLALLLLAAGHAEWHVVANLKDKEITESSGIATSLRNPGIFWTHNDSGDGPYVYAFDKTGDNRGTFRLEGAKAVDWEDMAAGPCPWAPAAPCLYMGDIGDNDRNRKEIQVYIVPEPEVKESARGTDRRHAIPLARLQALRLRYPDSAHDAESLLVHPKSGAIYVITKQRRGEGASVVYRVPSSTAAGVQQLRKVGEVRTDANAIPIFGTAFMLSGGAISHDGRHAIVRDYIQAYEFTLPDGARDFDEIWRTQPAPVDVGSMKQGEGVTYDLTDRRLYLTSEGNSSPLMEVRLPR